MIRQKQQLSKSLACYCSFTLGAALLLVTGCSRTVHVADAEATYYQIGHTPESDNVDEIISPYRAVLDSSMNKVIGECAALLTKAKPESTLGNWVADAVLAQASREAGHDIDFAIQNYGGIRINELAKGEVSVGKIYELMPFDNLIVVMTMSGRDIAEVFHHMARGGGWPISGTVAFEIRDDRAVNIRIHGDPIQESQDYTFALPDYIANGGDRADFLDKASREDLELLVRDALIAHVIETTEQGKVIDSEIEGRVTVQNQN